MQVTRRVSAILTLGALTMGLAGCGGGAGDSLPREAISGTVTFAGPPLSTGTIQFFPVKESGGTSTVAYGLITDGKFSIPDRQGLIPGSYKVIISSPPAGGVEAEEGIPPGPEAAKPAPKDMIPTKYNASSILTAEVKAGEENVFNFDLKR